MKELLLQYAAYNCWANQRLLGVLNGLDGAQLDRDLGSSFTSLRATVRHMWDVESIWLQRLQLATPVVAASSGFEGDWPEMARAFTRQSESLREFVTLASDAKLAHTIEYHHRELGICKSAVAHAVMTVFNHSTFHRGQLVAMLRQSGVGKIPATDFIAFTRIRK
ncbi:DinB family protein [Chitinophaga lutea]